MTLFLPACCPTMRLSHSQVSATGSGSTPATQTLSQGAGWGGRLWGGIASLIPVLRSQEALRRAAVSLGAIALYRLGFYVPLSNVKLAHLPASLHGDQSSSHSIQKEQT